MSSYIPILNKHDDKQVIGRMWLNENGTLHFELNEPMARDQVFQIFGGAGIVFREKEIRGRDIMVKAGTILEFSL